MANQVGPVATEGAHGLIGVVTVTYNSGSVLEPFLKCMAEQTYSNYVLYVVDNASKDATLEILAGFNDPRIVVIASQENLGVAEGNNRGILPALAAGCESILLLNNDTEFEPTMIEELAQGLNDNQVAMTCPKMMYFDEPNRIWSAGGAFQPMWGYRVFHYGEREEDRGQYDEQRIVTYVPTCCVLVSRAVFDKIGVMDARYFVYVDDVDFMYRALKAGFKLLYMPTIKLLHKVSSLTGQEEPTFTIRFGTRNRVFFLLKHFGWLGSLPFLAIYQVYYFGGLLTGRFKWPNYKKKQAAVVEGLRMWRTASREERKA